MRTIIAGGREITDYSLLERAVKNSGFNITEVVSGCARGADKLGEQYAEQNGIKLTKMPAEWDKHGRAAGPIRNGEMAIYTTKWKEDGEDGGGLIALWDGITRGTKNMIDTATKKGLQVHVERTDM